MGLMYGVPLRRPAEIPYQKPCVFLLGVFDRGLCLGISAYFCAFLRIVAGYALGLTNRKRLMPSRFPITVYHGASHKSLVNF
jgi:hypothetical protein